MAAASGNAPAANPCCSVWKVKCLKGEERRKQLRDAVNLLHSQLERIEADNASLKKAFEEERAKVVREKEGRVALENEISSLKVEISSLRQKGDAVAEGEKGEIELLRGHVSEREKEIEQLKKMLEKEKTRAYSEKKKAEVEKKSAVDAWKLVKAEKEKVDEERKYAIIQGKKAEEYRIQLEEMKKVAEEAESKLVSQNLKLDNVNTDLEATKCELVEESKCTDLGKTKADDLGNLAEEIEKNVKVEKSCADGLVVQLEGARQKIDSQKKEVNKSEVFQSSSEAPDNLFDENLNAEAVFFFENMMIEEEQSNLDLGFLFSDDATGMVEVEKQKALIEKVLADLEMAKADEQRKLAGENKKVAADEKLREDLEMAKAEEQRKLAEVNRKIAAEEKLCADSEMSKVEEQRKLDEVNRKIAAQEKLCADQLSLQLQESIDKNVILQKQIQELLSVRETVQLLERRLAIEQQNVMTQKKRADSEMERVEEHIKLAEVHRKMATEEKSRADQLSLQLGKDRLRMEELEKQMQEHLPVRETVELLERRLTLEQQKVMIEKKRADSEMKRVEEHRKLAEVHRKMATEEKSRADQLSLQLGKDRLKIEELEKQMKELLPVRETVELLERRLTLEQQKVMIEKKRADSQMKRVEEHRELAEVHRKMATEEKSRSDQLSLQLGKDRLKIEELDKQMQELLLCRNSMGKDMNAKTMKMKRIEDKLRFEKGGPVKEKNVTYLDGVKMGKKRRLGEENKKMVMKEKCFSEQLTGQLKEDRQRIDEMQKQIQLLITSRNMVQESLVSPNKTAEVKLLERQLKLEKKQSKHARQVAKMEKSRNHILQQELNRLKLDFVQILCRLDMLGNIYLPNVEGTRDMEKAAELALVQSSKLRNCKASLICQTYHQSENELLNASCMATSASDYLSQRLHYTAPCFSMLGGKLMGSISGIDSKLEPLIGASNQQILQSSAMNSSSASFSDAQLVGSQERGAFVPMPPELGEENVIVQQTVSAMSGEVTEIQQNENLAVVAQNNVTGPRSMDVGKINLHGWKSRVPDLGRSIDTLDLGQNLHVTVEEKQKYMENKMQDSSTTKQGRFLKKRKSSHGLKSFLEHSFSIDECEMTSNIGNGVFGANVTRTASYFANDPIAAQSPYREAMSDLFQCHPVSLSSFEEVSDGNYMRLLELDDAAEEECFQRAIEMPLSPTLPEVILADVNLIEMDKFKHVDDESFCTELSHEKQMFAPPHSLDVIEVDASSNILRHKACATSDCGALSNKDLHTSFPYDSSDILETKIPPNCLSENSIAKFNSMNISTSTTECPALLCGSENGSAHYELLTSFPIFSDVNVIGTISRILGISRTWITSSSERETGSKLKMILHALKKEKISTKEKACAFFGLLVNYFIAYNLEKTGVFFGTEFVDHVDAFAKEIKTVVSDFSMRSLFAELFILDELLGTMENFLIDGRVMGYKDSSSVLGKNGSRSNMVLDEKSVDLSCKSASVEHLVAASVILASICAATDCLGFICEASYNLLRVHILDDSVILIILHVFSHLGGEKFFSEKHYHITATVLKSIVMLLEGANSSVASASLSTLDNVIVQFHPFAECPFMRDAVPRDIVAKMLLEKLHGHAFSGIINGESTNSSHNSVVNPRDKAVLSSTVEEFHYSSHIDGDASCGLTKLFDASSVMVANGILCDLSDILSLVELLASRMSWQWTCGVIVSELLRMLKRPELDGFLVGVLALLGQLGRLGVASCGYEDKGVKNIRYKISSFLWWETTVRVALPVQIAAVSALLGLLTSDFQKIIQGTSKTPGSPSRSVSVDLIRSWFSLLSKEQQALTFDILQSAGRL